MKIEAPSVDAVRELQMLRRIVALTALKYGPIKIEAQRVTLLHPNTDLTVWVDSHGNYRVKAEVPE